jgi:predicted ATP-grasp superfamily ATP-dependent carboligase
MDKILVLGIYRQTLTVIRSLAKTGLDIIVGRTEAKQFIDFSRYTSEVWVHPSIEAHEEEFIHRLMFFLSERRDIHYIFPVDEPEVACIERHRDKLSSLAKLIIPGKNIFFTCIDKDLMYKVCTSIGVPIPETKVIRSLEELREGINVFGLPAIVKPNDGYKYFFGNKAIICHTQEELDTFFKVWPDGNEFIVLQKYITGYRHNCHFFAVEGVIQAYFEHKTLRTDRVNGTGLGVDNITVKPSPLLQCYCADLIKKLNYTGVGCVQFLVSNDQNAYFLEINPRLDANCAVPFRCGYDFPRFAFDFVKTQRRPASKYSKPYSIGKRAHWFMGDVYGLDKEIKRQNIDKQNILLWMLRILKTAINANFHVTWWWRDPLPTLFLVYRSCKGGIRRLREKIGHAANFR